MVPLGVPWRLKHCFSLLLPWSCLRRFISPCLLTPQQALAHSFCNGTTDEANLEFGQAVQQNYSSAQTAVAALLYAQTELACFEGSTILSVMSPPMSRECWACWTLLLACWC